MKFECEIGEVRDEALVKKIVTEILRQGIVPITGCCKVTWKGDE